jgi:hypothetical protein
MYRLMLLFQPAGATEPDIGATELMRYVGQALGVFPAPQSG